MIANLLVVAFVAFMAYWWGSQGLFSAALHLVSVIAAGALALAFWEPLVLNLLINTMPAYAWGVGLIGLFVLFLLLIRVGLDTLIKGNVYLGTIPNLLGGGLLGYFAGVLTAGVTIIGLSFMNLGETIGGYQPYIRDADGQIVENPEGELWISVDRQASGFFSRLSTGSFSTRDALAYRLPDLARQAGIFRLHPDPNATQTARPSAVEHVSTTATVTPFAHLDDSIMRLLGDTVRRADQTILLVETVWKVDAGTYDQDSTVRIAPTQVQLITRSPEGNGGRNIVFPLGASRFVSASDTSGEHRRFIPFIGDQVQLVGTLPEEKFTFMFILPTGDMPEAVLIRRLRFPITLPEEPTDPARMASAIGYLTASMGGPEMVLGDPSATRPDTTGTTVDPGEGSVGDRQGMRTGSIAKSIDVTNALPRPFSRNVVQGNLDLVERAIVSGQAEAREVQGVRLSPATTVDQVNSPGHRSVVRIHLDRDAAQSLLGRARAAAAMLQSIYITDDAGTLWQPIGYVWLKGDTQELHFRPNEPFTSAGQLPIAQLRDQEELYLYFLVNPGRRIVAYNVGQTKQDISLTVP